MRQRCSVLQPLLRFFDEEHQLTVSRKRRIQ
jgi:hypothetical protein